MTDDQDLGSLANDSVLLPLVGEGHKRLPPDQYGASNKAPIWSCVAVLAGTMLGAGVIGGPHAISLLGSILGCSLLLLSVFFSANGLYLLSLSAQTTGVRPATFYTLCRASIPRWTFVVDLAIAVKCFGVAISYLIVVGDLMPLAVAQISGRDDGMFASRWFWVTVSFATTIPLSFLRSLTALKYTSTLSITFVFTLAVVCLLFAFGALQPCGSDPGQAETCRGVHQHARWSMDALEALPVYIFAFTCHQNFPCLVNELERPTRPRILSAIGWAAGVACLTNLIIGEAAYAAYGSMIGPDILATFPRSTLSTVLRVLISILVTFAFPLQAHPARSSVLALVREASGEAPSDYAHQLRYYAITTAFLGLAYIIALSIKDLGLMLEVVGATGSTTVSYLLPGITYYRLHTKPHARRYLALLQFLLGCAIIPTCLTITVRKHMKAD